MPPPNRDPFPMTSSEAQSLQKSLEKQQDEEDEGWESMNVESQNAGPSRRALQWVESLTNNSPQINAKLQKYLKRDSFNSFVEDLKQNRQTLALAPTLAIMVGGYWLLRSLKDVVLVSLCGVQAIPRAKMLSVIVVLAVVTIYNKLIDYTSSHPTLSMHHLFYFFGTAYFMIFGTIAYLLDHEHIGLKNEVPNESRILGWISYCAIESFGSVMISLFWSFVNSTVSLEGAKATFGYIVAAAQLGSILGPTIVNAKVSSWGIPKVYFLGACCMLLIQATIALYIAIYGTAQKKTKPKKKTKAGVMEGLLLFWNHNYIKGIFAISCLFMVEVTIVDFTLKVLAKEHFSGLHPCQEGNSCWQNDGNHGLSQQASAAFATFMGLFGQATNTLSFLFSLFGTSFIIKSLGVRTTLLLFPSLCLVVIICVRLFPTLYVVFGAMMTLKACSYSLNNPTKEILYQPTSSAVKFKAKSWIDIFGARGSKALGSVVTNAFSYSASVLVQNGSLVGMAVSSFLIWNATYMGKKFDEYTNEGFIVGEDDEEDASDGYHIQLGETDDNSDNQGGSTSCALPHNMGSESGHANNDYEEESSDGEEDDDLIDDAHSNKSKYEGSPSTTLV